MLSFPPHGGTAGVAGPWINLIGWLDDKSSRDEK